jgi:hypothetical protein
MISSVSNYCRSRQRQGQAQLQGDRHDHAQSICCTRKELLEAVGCFGNRLLDVLERAATNNMVFDNKGNVGIAAGGGWRRPERAKLKLYQRMDLHTDQETGDDENQRR